MRKLLFFLIFVLFIQDFMAHAQCMMVPLSLSKRVVNASTIVKGRLTKSTSYLAADNRIYTSNFIEVIAYLKGHTNRKTIIVISEGGVLENRAEIVHPALELDPHHEVVLLLTEDNTSIDNKIFRTTYAGIPQMKAYGRSQGKFTYENGFYHDLLTEAPLTEIMLFKKINQITNLPSLTPEGSFYLPQPYTPQPVVTEKSNNAKITAISTVSPDPGIAGTINVADQLTISGSGFGSSVGTVEFSNADDGGGTYIQSPVPNTDIISWSDAQIVMKVPRQAGTGSIIVNGTFTIPYTVTYAHLEINDVFYNFADYTRQRYYLVNQTAGASGGYVFQLNTTFAANTAAVAAFERALATWRCNTFVNFSVSSTPTSNAVATNDGINTIFFDPTLDPGILGEASSSFLSVANGACTLQNTEWYASDIDIRFQTIPYTGFTWNYGPGASVVAGSTFDFESVALHELGHAHGLGHIVAPGKVMNYNLPNGSDVRTLDATSDIAGGNAKLAYSTVAANYCVKYPTAVTGPMVLLTTGSCSLPLSLIYFTANKINEGENLLTWSTSDEVNIKEFELSRSYDAVNFENIAVVEARGSSLSSQEYSYKDYSAVAEKTIYYKLTAIDLNDQTTSFRIAVIEESGSTKIVSIYFDPGDKVICTNLSKPVVEDTEWSIYNSTGQIVAKDKIASGSAQLVHHAYALTTGIYNYFISGNGIQLRGKLAVQQVW